MAPPDRFADALVAKLPELMRTAIELAKRGAQPFGCVLADYDTGFPEVGAANASANDPTMHAEINALQLSATRNLDPHTLVLVSTAEPCPMCASACYWAGVRGVVYGTSIATLLRFGWGQIDVPMHKLLRRARPPSTLLLLRDYGTEWTDDLYRSGPRGKESGD